MEGRMKERSRATKLGMNDRQHQEFETLPSISLASG